MSLFISSIIETSPSLNIAFKFGNPDLSIFGLNPRSIVTPPTAEVLAAKYEVSLPLGIRGFPAPYPEVSPVGNYPSFLDSNGTFFEEFRASNYTTLPLEGSLVLGEGNLADS
jgi:hypothetical protein